MSIIEKVLEKLDKNQTNNTVCPDQTENIDNSKIVCTKQAQTNEKISIDTNKQQNRDGNSNKKQKSVHFNYERLKSFGLLTPDNTNVILAEQYRRIKRQILHNVFENDLLDPEKRNLIMVTSSILGEGKSFTAFNLAMSIAKEINQTVLYIDVDVTRQMLPYFIGSSENTGLTDFLLNDGLELSDLLLRTDIPNLTLLPAGKDYDRTTELLASNKMCDLMMEIAKRYDDRIVIFDAPPILQHSSAHIMARLVGQIILVVEAEKTSQQIVKETLNTLKDTQYIGLILNKTNQRFVSDHGYYGLID